MVVAMDTIHSLDAETIAISMECGLDKGSHDTTVPGERLEQAAKYNAGLAYQRIFGDIKSLEHINEQLSVKKAALIKARDFNPWENFSLGEAAILCSMTRETLTKRLALAGGNVYMGIHVGRPHDKKKAW
jgi:hypothetical protein